MTRKFLKVGGKMRNGFLAVVLCSLLAGCSTVTEKVIPVVGKDLDKTVDLASRYGKPNVAQCAVFLQSVMSAEDSTLAQIEALSKEDTAGLLSSALKAALIAEMVRGLDDPAKRAQIEADFRANCSAVAGDIMLNLARDAARLGKKRIGL